MWSLGWAIIQYEWGPYAQKESHLGYQQKPRDGLVWIQAWDICPNNYVLVLARKKANIKNMKRDNNRWVDTRK